MTTGNRRASQHTLAVLAVTAVLVSAAVPAGAATTPDASSCPSFNPPNALTLVSGTPQTAKLGTPFADPLQVALANTDGCPITTPVAGTAITFAAPGSGPSGTFSSSGSNAALVGTNAAGTATAPELTSNRLAGGYTVVASSDYGSVGFSLVNTASGVPSTIASQSAPSQSADISARYEQPLQARVLDAAGAPVAGVSVTFTLGADAGGSGSGAAGPGASFLGGQGQATATTDDSGIATSPLLTANAVAGKFTATAATAGIAAPATFDLDNLAGKPPAVKPVGAHKLSATVATGYHHRLEVKVTDASDRPLQGESVTFTLGSSGGGGGGGGGTGGAGSTGPGGSFPDGSTQATETTGADGIATSPRIVANATAGAFTAVAAVAGIAEVAQFSLDNLAGRPPKMRSLGQKTRSAVVGRRYGSPLRVRVTDARGKPLQGETVTFTLGSGGGGGAGAAAGATFVGGSAQASETTNASGIATSPPFEADSTAGAFTAAATVAGTNASAGFQLVNLAGRGLTLRAVTPRLSATVGSRYGRPLELKVLDAHGRPLEGQTVTFTLGSTTAGAGGGGSGSPAAGATFTGGSAQATATTNSRGIAISPRPIANTTAGTFEAAVTVTSSTATATIRLDNRAGAPAAVVAGAAATESTPIGTRFGIPLAVTVTDKHGNPVAGVLVTFAAPRHGAGGSFAEPHHRRLQSVHVRTNAAGIAVAPSLIANRTAGGYAVKATVGGAPAAAFGLVNLPPGL